MKIGIDARAAKWYRGTGIGTYSYQLINSLNNIDNINDYLLFTSNEYNNEINFKKNFKFNCIDVQNNSTFWDEINVPNILKDNTLDIYHVPQNGIGLPLDKNCPFVITLHDTIPLHMPETVGDRYLDIFNKNMNWIVNNSDAIITVSNYSKEDISRDFNYPKEKIFVTYLASEDIYIPLDKSICKFVLKRIYNLDDNYILYVGGFSPRKNILGLIDAYSKLPEYIRKKHKLVISGSKGKSYMLYRNRAEKYNLLDDIIFPGFISMDHMPYLYNCSSLFVYPSFYEGFGLPPIEAMACGIPVIASNATSLPEILGDSACLFDPNDIDDLSNKILDLLENTALRKHFINAGLQKINSLSWNKTAKETLAAYKQIYQNHK